MATGEGVDRVEREHRPSPIDVHVGGRVRLRRTLLGMSQEKLGEALGLTFQQVQKYEKGTNRVGASRLQQISEVLQVPVSFLFDGGPSGIVLSEGSAESASPAYIADFLATSEGLALTRAFTRIPDSKLRRSIVDLVEQIADREAAENGVKSTKIP
jgi:transcriptional regulator with XRE-family HTH domain